MQIAAKVLLGIAAGIHVYIWVLESIRWTHPSTRKVFGVRSAADAETMRQMAFNQGFYNLFLALAVFVGIWVHSAVDEVVGSTLMVAGGAMMVLAALVLVISSRRLYQAAMVQGLAPALGLLLLALSF